MPDGREHTFEVPEPMWHEGPCIPHPDHSVEVACAVCYACRYHVKAERERIAKWLDSGHWPKDLPDALATMSSAHALECAGEAILKGEHHA